MDYTVDLCTFIWLQFGGFVVCFAFGFFFFFESFIFLGLFLLGFCLVLRKNLELGDQRQREDLEGPGGGEEYNKVYFMLKITLNNKNYNKKEINYTTK